MADIITTTGLTKRYKTMVALDSVGIHVPAGSIYGLVGDNGAGKSTLLKVLAGQVFSTSGSVEIMGKSDEDGLNQVRRQMGVMIESPKFFPELQVEQQIEYYRIQKGIPDEAMTTKIMKKIGLMEKRRSKCKGLSMGQRQRLGLAIALIGSPQILLLDEPINGLDPSGVIEIRNLLRRLSEERRVTVLLSSHILAELQQLATNYGFISHGRIIKEISARQLHEESAGYIEIKVSDVDKMAVLLEKHFTDDKFKVIPDKSIRVYKPRHQSGDYSRVAFDNHINISELRQVESSLEDYYVQLKEENRHA